MDFDFTEEQETVAKVARELFEHRATPEHLTDLESGDVRFDESLWRELAAADLLGISLPENVGGSGQGFVELALLLAEVGWSVAPVPVYATLLLGADTIARFGDDAQRERYLPAVVDGSSLLTAGLAEPGRSDPTAPATTARRDGDGWRLDGVKELVPAAQLARTVVIPASLDDDEVGVFLLDADIAGVDVRPVVTTNGEPHADMFMDGAAASERLAGGPGDPRIALCPRPCRSVRDTTRRHRARAADGGVVHYRTRTVRQADRQLPGRQQRMADAFIDVEAIRWTMWQAAWLLDQGGPPGREAGIAKFWAAEAGSRVAATAQQVHGGIGIDTTYPLFRYFLWAKHNEVTLGSASAQLTRLGTSYLEGDR